MKRIGPAFAAEIEAAGLSGLPFGWTPDGQITYGAAMTPEQIAAVEAVYAAHDPDRQPPPTTADVDAERDRRLAAGYQDATTGKTYQCRERDIAVWTAIAADAGFKIASAASGTYDIITADNSVVQLNEQQTFSLFTERVMPWVSATYLHARALKDQILAGETPDITQGWPAFTQD